MTPLEHCPSGMRTFTMERIHDETGVSGEGIVLEGAVFSVGTCVVHWLTPTPRGSIAVWDSFEAFENVHIKPHPTNETVIHWND